MPPLSGPPTDPSRGATSAGAMSRRERVEALLDEALDLEPDQRAEFLARRCDGDPSLRREVESLLDACEQSGLTGQLAGVVVSALAQHVEPSPTAVAPYEIVARVGSGGMGVVYKARDPRLQRFVALKFLTPSLSAAPELRTRLLHEAKAIAALDHPNVCTIHDVVEPDAGQLVLVMPYYEGETLAQKIARGPLPVADALEYARQVADGLAHAHAAGVIHRDIKPANVMVTAGGRVKILDFGIAKVSAGGAALTRTGAVLGTVSYMSPEQSRGDPVDGRTDLWALGAVLYEMVAGRPPFAADSMEALVYAIQWRGPEALSALRPDVPPAVESLVHGLLEREPTRRYADAGTVADALESFRAQAPDAPDPSPAHAPSRTPLVGRGSEVARLVELFERAAGGARQLVVVAGEPGIGKSTLVEMLLERLAPRGGLRVGRGQCLDQRGAGEPYMPVLEALGRLCRAPDGEQLVAVLERHAPTWLAQLPSLLDAERLEAVRRRAYAATRVRMLREMVEALDAFAADTPLLLVLEDLHWSDPSTLDLLVALAQRPEPARLLVLATYRPGDADRLVAPLRALRAQGRVAELPLDRWSEADARDYLAVRYGRRALPEGVDELVLRRTGGHPLFVRSLMDEWQESGALVRDTNGWRLGVDLDQLAGTMPESLRASIEQRIDALSPAHRELLEGASVAGAAFEVAAVAAALDRDEDALEAELAELVRPGWIAAPITTSAWPDGTVTGRYGFGHHLHQELFYSRVPLARRARFHARIGRRLESAYGARAAERAAELALHFSRARDDGRTARYLTDAARQAIARSAHAEAIGHLEGALDVLGRLPDVPERGRAELEVQRMLGPSLLVTRGWGDPDAEHAYERARALSERLEDRDQLGRVLYGLAYLHEIRGNYPHSQSLIEERLRLSVASEEPAAALESHELLSCTLFHQGSFDASLQHARRGLDLGEAAARGPRATATGENAWTACFSWAGLALWFLGHPDEAVARTESAVAMSADESQSYMRSLAEIQAARLFQYRREPERVREHAERAHAIAERLGSPYRIAIATTLLGWAEVADGNVAAGLERLRLGIERQEQLGARMERPYSLGLLADALARAGDDDDALARIDEVFALPEMQSRSYFWTAELHRLRGTLLFRRGDAEAAEASLRRALELAVEQGARALELRTAVSLLAFQRATGRGSDAPALVRAALATFTEGLDTPDLRDARAALGLVTP